MFTKIQPIRPKLIPPPGSEQVDVIKGRPLYRLTRPAWSSEPLLDENGQVVLKKDNLGRAVQTERRPVEAYETIEFFLWDQGNGNEELELHLPPTASELAESEKKRRLETIRATLDEALLASSLTPEEIAERLTAPKNKGGRPPKNRDVAEEAGEEALAGSAPPEY